MRIILQPQQGYKLYVFEVTIPNGQSESEAFATQGLSPVGIIMPAAWTAAEIRFKGAALSTDTFKNITDVGGTAPRVTVSASVIITPVGNDAIFSPQLKLVSTDGTGVAVNQGADRVIQLVMAPYLS